ncbi:hypothetical protein A2U01_0005891 [Trifolium medium]|uniref:Uncharacterized protein n=1 Tax=Trifolium medium TaxID=97028 RepID=A0A392MDB7_9FABA|nr:hypothetical protein [Trifolium medium]
MNSGLSESPSPGNQRVNTKKSKPENLKISRNWSVTTQIEAKELELEPELEGTVETGMLK